MDETGIELVEDTKEEAKESKKGVELIEKSKKKAKGTIIDDKVIEALDNLSLDDLKRDFEEEEKQQQQEEEKSFKKFKKKFITDSLILKLTQKVMKEGERVKGWTYHNELLEHVPTIEEIYQIIHLLKHKALKYAAALCIIYLAGARGGEVLKSVQKRFFNEQEAKKYGRAYSPIRLKDIVYHEDIRGDYVTITTPIEKLKINILKSQEEYKVKYKKCYIPVNKMYKPFLDVIFQYIDTIESSDPNYPLFYFMEDTLSRQLRRNVGKMSVHIFRHWRASHLVRYHGFKEGALRVYMGWTKTSPMAMRYTHFTEGDFLSLMRNSLYE